MSTLPSNIATFLLTIFAISFVICVLLPLSIGFWRQAHTLTTAVPPGTIGGMVAGLIVTTILLVLLGTALHAPAGFLYPTIGLIDLLLLFFLCVNCITAWIAHRQSNAHEEAPK